MSRNDSGQTAKYDAMAKVSGHSGDNGIRPKASFVKSSGAGIVTLKRGLEQIRIDCAQCGLTFDDPVEKCLVH